MKKIMNYLMYTTLLVIALSFTACQEEFEEPFEEQSQEIISANSTAAVLLEQTVSKDGSFDNIVDGSSCFGISFPYTVAIEGLEITVDSIEDLNLIEEIFDAVDDDDDILNIIFPITIIKPDYSEVIINSKEELRELAADCVEGGDDEDIECIDFVYPITFFTFDLNNERTGEVVINSDKEFRRFFAALGDSGIVSIDFPVTLIKYDGTEVVVNSNAELVAAIEAAKEACDEDDDDDFNDDDFTKERLDNLLVECPWLVKEIKRNNQLSTDQYIDYALNFKEDGTVVARDREGNILFGEWYTRVTDFRVKLTLEFEFIEDFSLEWFVYEIDKTRIKLFIIGSDGDKIIMKQACNEPEPYCPEEFIKDKLQTCKWAISRVVSTSFLDYLLIDFSNMNIHVYNPNGVVVDEGNWVIQGNILSFNDLSGVLANYNGRWKVIRCSPNKFKIQRGDEFLILEKDCNPPVIVCPEAFILDTLQDCTWYVSDGNDGNFPNYLEIDFSNMNIHVYNPNGIVIDEGSWDIEGNILVFNNLTMDFENYTGEWEVIECDSDRFKLQRGDEYLIIEKECD